MTARRRIEHEIEVPAAPEDAWAAIATGPGITAWFMPAEVEGRVGGSIVHRHEADLSTPGVIRTYDPPHRFAYEEQGWMADGEHAQHPIATEFLIEARSGGTCVVRVVMSGFGDGDEWDRAMASFSAGWRQALVGLRLYLRHFRGEPVGSVSVGAVAAGERAAIWAELTDALGLPAEPAAGERVATDPRRAPALAGVVDTAGERLLTILLDEPARGIGFVGAGGPADQVYTFVRAQLFGQDAVELAAREQAAWRAWFAARAPAPSRP